MSNDLRNFLQLSYEELEELNLKAKEQRLSRVPIETIREERLKYLGGEKRIKAVTVMFSDLEGRLHMLDYDKKFLLKSWDNLTFDGSSIRGFTAQKESDLRLGIDWAAFYWGPAVPRKRQIRVCEPRRILSLTARRPAADLYRQERRSAAGHGVPE